MNKSRGSKQGFWQKQHQLFQQRDSFGVPARCTASASAMFGGFSSGDTDDYDYIRTVLLLNFM